MSLITQDMQQQIDTLDQRRARYRKCFVWLAILALGTAILWGVFSLIASYAGPVVTPGDIDVPTSIETVLSKASPADVKEGSTQGISMADSMADMQSWMKGIMLLAGGLLILMMPFLMFTGSISAESMLPMLLGGMGIVGSVFLMSIFLPDQEEESAQQVDVAHNPQELFDEALGHGDMEGMGRVLAAIDMKDSAAGDYVMAQMALKHDREVGTDYYQKVAGNIGDVEGLTPKPEALYALEHAAYGEARSVAARGYRDDRVSNQQTSRELAGISLAIMGVTVLAATLYLAIWILLSRRLSRVGVLVQNMEARIRQGSPAS